MRTPISTIAFLMALASAVPIHAATYTYDALGRLVAESYPNNAHILYTYDATGNRLTRTTVAPNANPSADLSLTLTLSPNPPSQSGALTATITVTNNGPDHAPEVAVSPNLPANFQAERFTASQGTASAAGINLGLLPAGATATVTIEGTVIGSAPLTVTATASSSADSTPGNNTANAGATPTASADLVVTRFFGGPDPLVVPTPIGYFAEVTNLGPSVATGVVLTTTLDADSSFIDAVPASTANGRIVTTPLGSLAVGEIKIVEITADTAAVAPQPGRSRSSATHRSPRPSPIRSTATTAASTSASPFSRPSS